MNAPREFNSICWIPTHRGNSGRECQVTVSFAERKWAALAHVYVLSTGHSMRYSSKRKQPRKRLAKRIIPPAPQYSIRRYQEIATFYVVVYTSGSLTLRFPGHLIRTF